MKTIGMTINQTGNLRRHIQKVITKKASPASNWFVAPNSGQRMRPPVPALSSDHGLGVPFIEAIAPAITTANKVAPCFEASSAQIPPTDFLSSPVWPSVMANS